MKMKGIWGLLTALILSLGLLAPAEAQTGRFWLQAVGDNNEAITNGRCVVLTAGANTLPTIYTSATLGTAASNPLTMDSTTGVCEWYLSSGTTAVDVLVLVDSGPYKGSRIRVDNVTRTGQHTVRVNRSAAGKVVALPFTATASTSAQTPSGYTLPPGALIRDAVVQTWTAVATSTINAGTAQDDSDISICSAVSTGSVGFANCGTTAFVLTANRQLRYHNQNHASAGLIWIYYNESGNEP